MLQMFAYVKNEFVPADEAVVSIKERGFRFGDGAFETIRVCDGVPYQWELHMERMQNGLDAIKIPFSVSLLEPICNELLLKNAVEDGLLRISVSRGIGSLGYLPTANDPTIVIETLELPEQLSAPIELWQSTTRKLSGDSLPTEFKLMQGLNSTLARIEAQDNHCYEALMMGENEEICECSSSNLFWITGDTLYTPAIDSGVLAGTTREAILRVSPFINEEGTYYLDDLKNADEVLVTNAAWQILPVSTLLPEGIVWNKRDKINQLKSLLEKDIEEYVAERSQGMDRPAKAS